MEFNKLVNQILTEAKKSKMKKGMKKGVKPDYLDMDEDGNKKESFKKAVTDKKKKPFGKKKAN